MRGLLSEYGIVLPQGPVRFRQAGITALDEPSAELTPLVIELFHSLVDQLRALEDRLTTLDRRIVALCRQSELCRRLAALPAVGPVVATALVASVGTVARW
jgi:transposase